MHELMLDFLRDAPTPYALARFSLDDGALMALFAAGPGAPSPHRAAVAPRWIAKTTHTPAGRRRLRAEARALGQLEPWATALGLPRLLGWSETPSTAADLEAAPSACLIQSGMPGAPPCEAWSKRQASPPPAFRAATDWLRRFQRLVPAPSPASLAELTEWTFAQADDDLRRHPRWAPLLAALPPLLAAVHRPSLAQLSTVAIHGDFWAGNVLVPPSAGSIRDPIHVIDWSGFDADTALYDYLTWMSHPAPAARRHATALEHWIAVFFTPGPARDAVRDWAASVAYPEAVARAAFFLFLIRRLRWELGLGMQARNPTEIEAAHHDWTALLAWLAQHRYPDPFTPFPL